MLFPHTVNITTNDVTSGSLFAHEYGHIIHAHTRRFRSLWKKAIKEDGCSVSTYGNKNIFEDFAETLVIYSDPNSKLHERYRTQFPNRFFTMDSILRGEHMRSRSYFPVYNE